MDAAEDETAMSIGSTLWFHYDDLKDYTPAASAQGSARSAGSAKRAYRAARLRKACDCQ